MPTVLVPPQFLVSLWLFPKGEVLKGNLLNIKTFKQTPTHVIIKKL